MHSTILPKEGKLQFFHNTEKETIYEAAYEIALAAYDQAIQLAPYEGSLRYHKGTVLERMGRHEEAQRAYEEARSRGYTR